MFSCIVLFIIIIYLKFEKNILSFQNLDRMYRIEWISRFTNYRGHGSWFKPGNKKMLEESIEFMNKEYRGQFDHWLVDDS
jgi:hypothetical protein